MTRRLATDASCRHSSRTYYYNTYENPAIVSVALADYDATGAEIIQVA